MKIDEFWIDCMNVYELHLEDRGYIIYLNGHRINRFKSRIAVDHYLEEVINVKDSFR